MNELGAFAERTTRDLSGGIDTMAVRLDTDGRPIVWTVLVDKISLSQHDGDKYIDARSGDSLYVIDSTAVRAGLD